MNEIINTLEFNSFLAFAMTYLLHSTVWILMVAFLTKTPFFQTPLLRNYLWKAALIGGLTTTLFTTFYGNTFFNIPIETPVAKEIPVVEQPIISSTIVVLNESPTPSQETMLQENTTPIISASPVSKSTFDWSICLVFLFAFWLIGSLFLFLKVLGEHWFFFKKTFPRIAVNNPKVLNVFKNIQEKANLNQSVLLTQSVSLDSPILIRNQEICLPVKAIVDLKEEQLEAMIAHEFAHIARKDYYWTCALAVFEILFFFQPLHAWAKREIGNNNELLCDAWAAKITGNNLAVAQCLLTVATWIKERPRNYALVAGMSLKKSELSNRVQSLIQFSNGKNVRFSVAKIGLLLTCLLAGIVFILPAFSFSNLMDKEATLSEVVIEKETPITNLVAVAKEEDKIEKVEVVSENNSEKKICKPHKNIHHRISKERFDNLPAYKKECAYLLAAVKENNISEVKNLLKTSKADCLFCGGSSPSAPLNAATRNENYQIVKILLESGADIYNKSCKDEGALISTARNGNVAIMKLLDDYGAYFDYEVKGYGTVLTNAIKYNQYEMVSYLLDHNADPLKPLENGKTAMDYAQAKGGKMLNLFSELSQNNDIVALEN